MMQLGETMPSAAGAGWQAVEIPYVGGSLAMTVILPDDLAAFEQALTADRLAAITGALAGTQVALTLPKFSIETKAELATSSPRSGCPRHSPMPPTSPGSPPPSSSISDVIHQANIDVDEKGTEAAAATAVVMRAGPRPPSR